MNHKGTVKLETERLILRRYLPEDAEDMLRNWAQSERVTRYLTWEPYKSIEDANAYIRFLTGEYEKPDCYNWAIELEELGQAVGSISVVALREDVSCAEIGYCLGDGFWGRGIMPEALNEVIRFLFEEVGCNRIQASHDVNNPNSGKVMEKCGMRYEGTLRQYGRNNQGVCDSVIRSILRKEYLCNH